MKRMVFLMVVTLFVVVISCGGNSKKAKETVVKVTTDFGEIIIKLYDDTPKHRDNFVKLINEGFYNDLLFHRVMINFMIQGGDPNSRDSKPDEMLGSGGPGYTIPAEINGEYFHKKGAVAAARRGGPGNPEKNSSGSQFYIVQGKVFRTGELDTLEMAINKQRKDLMLRDNFEASKDKFNEFKEKNDKAGFDILVAEIRAEVDSIYEAGTKYKMSKEQRDAYSTIGGYPSLDGEYTVFGEVVEGLDVLDKIAEVKVNSANRPLEDVRMKIEIVK